LYVLNAAALSKVHAVQQLAADLLATNTDVAIITETHFKHKLSDNLVNIDGYTLYRRDRPSRRGGGVAVYIKNMLQAAIWTGVTDDKRFEVLWIQISETLFIAAVYHPPRAAYSLTEFLDFLETSINEINERYKVPYIVMAGDFNQLPDSEVVERSGLLQIVRQPTRGDSLLDRIFVTDTQYNIVRVITSTVRSDHKAVVAYTNNAQSQAQVKTSVRRSFRRKTPIAER
jgi:exonuclease III